VNDEAERIPQFATRNITHSEGAMSVEGEKYGEEVMLGK
jgi:hypothetical protein